MWPLNFLRFLVDLRRVLHQQRWVLRANINNISSMSNTKAVGAVMKILTLKRGHRALNLKPRDVIIIMYNFQ